MTATAMTPSPRAYAKRARALGRPAGHSLNRASRSPMDGSSLTNPTAGNSDPVSRVDSWRPAYLIAIFMTCVLSPRMFTRPLLASSPLIDSTRPRRSALKCAGVRDRVRDSVRAQSLVAVSMCGMCGIFLSCERRRARARRRRRARTCAHTYTAPHIPHIPHISGAPTLSGSSNPAPNPARPAPALARPPHVQFLLNLKRIEVEGKDIHRSTPVPGAFVLKGWAHAAGSAFITHPGGGERDLMFRIPVEHATAVAL